MHPTTDPPGAAALETEGLAPAGVDVTRILDPPKTSESKIPSPEGADDMKIEHGGMNATEVAEEAGNGGINNGITQESVPSTVDTAVASNLAPLPPPSSSALPPQPTFGSTPIQPFSMTGGASDMMSQTGFSSAPYASMGVGVLPPNEFPTHSDVSNVTRSTSSNQNQSSATLPGLRQLSTPSAASAPADTPTPLAFPTDQTAPGKAVLDTKMKSSSDLEPKTTAPPSEYNGPPADVVTDVSNVLSLLMKAQQDKTKVSKLTRRRKRGPQPPLSAVSYFRFDTLHEVCTENPVSSPEEIILMIENKWELLEDSKKKIYQEKADLDKKRYEEETKLYLPKSQGGRMKRPKARKHPGAPKHPKSAYLYFVADTRKTVKLENPGKSFTEIAQLLGKKWRALPKEQVVIYEAKATADKNRYKREKEEYSPPTPVVEQKKVNRRRKKHPLAPKHPLSAYLFFVATNRPKMSEKYPDRGFSEIASILGMQWKTLPREDRRIFEILAYADKKRYLEEKEKWVPPHQNTREPKRRKKNNDGQDPSDPMLTDWMYEGFDAANTGQHSGINPPPLKPNLLMGHWPQQGMVDGDVDHEALGYAPPTHHLGGLMMYRNKPSRYDPGIEILNWGAMEISRFIGCLGFPNLQNTFLQSGITGKQFIRLKQPELRARFGVHNIGDRKKIVKAISDLIQG